MKKKLLLADDSITIRKVVGMIFAAEDYELLVTGDGNTAYEMAVAHKPELVIADVSMPGKDGFELCRAVKSHPALTATSVLLLPGAFEVFDEEKATLAGADGWLVKPFESKALIDKVEALLSIKPLRIEPVDDAVEDTLCQQEAFPAANGLIDDSEDLPEVPVEEELSIEDEDRIWGTVSFEEENLKPQDLLAATDADEEEEDSELDTDSPWNDIVSVEHPGGSDLASETDEDELIELMDDDLLDEDGLMEDRETFVGHDEDDADDFEADSDDYAADNEILDLTESDIVESTDSADEPLLEVDTSEETEPVDAFVAADSATNKAQTLWPDDEANEDTKPPFSDQDNIDFGVGVNDETSPSVELTSEEGTPGFVFTDARELPVAESSDAQDHDFTFVDDEGSVNTDSDSPEQEAAPEFAYVAASVADVEGEEDDVNLLSGTPAPPAPGQQIEDQLSALSEEELKQIIERVAGPMIEKLAKDLLEKMVWEVVPDLAEALIREEIQKIKTDNN